MPFISPLVKEFVLVKYIFIYPHAANMFFKEESASVLCKLVKQRNR